jgi:hypothetical protein
MSAQTAAGSTANFSAIFDVALDDFETRTGQNLTSHPFTISLGDKDSPDAILEIFRKQVQAFDKSCRHDGKLVACLTCIVDILFALSSDLDEDIRLVRPHSFHIMMF